MRGKDDNSNNNNNFGGEKKGDANGGFKYDFNSWKANQEEKPVDGFNYDFDKWKTGNGKPKAGPAEHPGFNYDFNSWITKSKQPGFNYDFGDWETATEKRPGFNYYFDSWRTKNDQPGFNYDFGDWETATEKPGFNYDFDSWKIKTDKPGFSYDFGDWKTSGRTDEMPTTETPESNLPQNDANAKTKLLNLLLKSFFESTRRQKRQISDVFSSGSFGYDFDKSQFKSRKVIVAAQRHDGQRRMASVNGFNYDFKDYKNDVGRHDGDVEKKSNWIPGSVTDVASWLEYKTMLMESMQNEKAVKNLALFMFCKLKNFM